MGVCERRLPGVLRLRWLCGVVAAAVSLSACGSVTMAPAGTAAGTGPASQVRSAQGGTLCADAGAVTRLTVSRVNSLPANHPRFSFPASVAVPGAAQARAVARALCGLQPVPRGIVSCPADFGIIYRLEFASAGRGLPPVTIRAGGCEGVSGVGPGRWILRSPAFWAVLGKAISLTNPGHAAFTGTMPS